MSAKISELLSDPKGMEKIKSMADMLFSQSGDKTTDNENQSTSNDIVPDGFSLPDGFDVGKIMSIVSLLGSRSDDKRASLLMALKPHLTEERQIRVDKAVKILKIISIIPLLKEQGLLELF